MNMSKGALEDLTKKVKDGKANNRCIKEAVETIKLCAPFDLEKLTTDGQVNILGYLLACTFANTRPLIIEICKKITLKDLQKACAKALSTGSEGYGTIHDEINSRNKRDAAKQPSVPQGSSDSKMTEAVKQNIPVTYTGSAPKPIDAKNDCSKHTAPRLYIKPVDQNWGMMWSRGVFNNVPPNAILYKVSVSLHTLKVQPPAFIKAVKAPSSVSSVVGALLAPPIRSKMIDISQSM